MISSHRSEVIPELLRSAELSFHDGIDIGARSARPDDLASHAHHLADGVARLVTQPAAASRLWDALERPRGRKDLAEWLPLVLDGAIGLAGADRGDIQILDPATGALRLVASSGFDENFVDAFTLVVDERTACGRAARHGRQVHIDDVGDDELFAPHRRAAAAAGFATVQSTPLRGATGQLVGVMSTHWNVPRRLDEGDLRLLDLHGDLVGDRLCQLLAGPDVAVPPPRDARRGASSRNRAGPVARSFPHHRFSPLMDEILASVWSTGRALDQARGSATAPADRHHLEPAAARVDAAVRHIRSFVLELDDAGGHSGWPEGSGPTE